MIDMKWITIAAALALGVALPACTSASGDVAESPGPEVMISGPIYSPGEDNRPLQGSASLSPKLPEPTPQILPEDEVFSPTPSAMQEPEPIMGLISEGEAVEESWFADAVFVGDSRTDGLKLYSGLKVGTFFSYKGLSVFSIDDKACIPLEGKTVTVLEALSSGTFAKVYVLLGINELGYRDTKAFKMAYTDLVTSIRECQPEATIYLQLQPPVNEVLAASKGLSESINNERIILFNGLISQVAEEQGTALVNIWEALADPDGSLPADLTSDGVHMKRAGYELWYSYLRTHTGNTPVVKFQLEGEPVDAPTPVQEGQPSSEPIPPEEVVR